MIFVCVFSGSVVTVGNIAYVFLFGWWISLFYILICPLMFLTIFGAPYGMYVINNLRKMIFFLTLINMLPSFFVQFQESSV